MAARMISGDESAFDLLYRSYSGRLYRMAYMITGNKGDSEDAVQEAFVKCFLHRTDLKDPECFEAWLYRILVRAATKLAKKRREISLDALLEEETGAAVAGRLLRDEGGEPLAQLLESELTAEIWQAVSRLGVKHRTVVVLYYYNGLGTREIARITGTLEGTVKSRLFQARKALRSDLEQKMEGRGIVHG